MKMLAFFLACLIGCGVALSEEVSFKGNNFSLKGFEYRNPVFTKLDGVNANVKHDRGVSKIPLEMLDVETRGKLGFDEVAYQAQIQEEARLRKELEEKQAAIQALPLKVECITVKAVDGKARWFFRLHNHKTQPYLDGVKIYVIGGKGDRLGGEVFTAKAGGIEPGMGSVVFFDTNTGLSSTHGDYGIVAFECLFVKNGKSTGEKTEGTVPSSYTL